MGTKTQKTHWKKLRNPDYLGTWALEPGQDIIVTIKFVRLEAVTGADGKKEDCIVAYFMERDTKPMIINTTNAKTIAKLYKTPYVEEWAGCKIQIYTEQVKAFGDVVDALRIRNKIPTQKEVLTPDNPRWAGAVQSLRDGTITMDGIKKHFNITAEHETELLKQAAELVKGSPKETEVQTCQEQAI